MRGVEAVVGVAGEGAPCALASRPSFRGRRVLAADDSAVNREVLAEALGRLGVEVTSVTSGAEALAAVEAGRFDLVFMDGSMPDMDGFEASRRIRASEAAVGRAPIPIVALTAHVIGRQAQAWRQAGMSDFIAKPFTLEAIARCLERWLEAPHPSPAIGPDAAEAGDAWQPRPGDGPLIDDGVLASIREMQAEGDDLVGRVVALYGLHAPRLLAGVLALAPAATTDLADAAHALKSLSRNVGAVRVADLCDGIETAARDGRTTTDADFSSLEAVLVATLAHLGSSDDARLPLPATQCDSRP